MTAPTLATVTGTAWRNTSATTTAETLAGRRVTFRPLVLDESGALVDSASQVHVRTDAAGAIEAKLWPGAWRIHLWDGEVIDGPHHTGVVVEAGGVYTLEALRGYVPGPGVSVQVMALPTAGSGYLARDAEGDLSWATPAAAPSIVDNGDGTLDLSGSLVTDNLDGTLMIGA